MVAWRPATTRNLDQLGASRAGRLPVQAFRPFFNDLGSTPDGQTNAESNASAGATSVRPFSDASMLVPLRYSCRVYAQDPW